MMIHAIVGTKAQFIKMAPVIKEFESRGVPYNFINIGQHAATLTKLIKLFGIKNSWHKVQDSKSKDVSSIFEIAKWATGHLLTVIFRPRYLKEVIFKGEGGIVLVHGDTLSTFIGMLMAKRGGLKVAHVESGLRSWNYLHPFPEEIIRVICMRFSDYLFAPSDEAVENLKRMKVKVEVEGKRRIFNTGGNTGMDAVKAVVSGQGSGVSTIHHPYVLVSIHRFENLYSRKRFRFILDTIDEVSKRLNVIFVMHGPTERKLRKTVVSGQWSVVSNADHRPPTTGHSVTYLSLQDYPTFLHLIKDAEFVITDGGSVQEECYCLGKPCLIMRKRTERYDGIGENAVLGYFDKDTIERFIKNYKIYERQGLETVANPSHVLIRELLNLEANK